MLLTALAGPAAAAATVSAPPDSPVVVSPPAGADVSDRDPVLRVAVSDPDSSSLRVTFYGRASGGDGSARRSNDFTVAVLPDTQNYGNNSRNGILDEQTQWLVGQRQSLGLAFVTHLGDMVGTYDYDPQWRWISRSMGLLDSAGVPSSVLPGNHDMSIPDGAAPLFDQYFPVSRYQQAGWNSATARYGGYYGQGLFGPDSENRQNKDNFALFSVGGLDFVIVNLEYQPSEGAVAWAGRVLDAYKDRRAIIATHSFLGTWGGRSTGSERPGGQSGQQLWDTLIKNHCSVFLVVSGHFSDGEDGEAHRSDPNSCGQPVHQVLTDYQSRANGGDGWLRYYSFSPSRDEIQAVTYSPHLGRFEEDADSSFTLPYDMGGSTSNFTAIGTVDATDGQAALSWPNRAGDTGYEWYAAVSDGESVTTGPVSSFRVVSTPPALQPFAVDGFERTSTNGWGTADTGGPWTHSGGTTSFTVTNGTGRQNLRAGYTLTAALTPASTDTDLTSTTTLDKLPVGGSGLQLTTTARKIGNDGYHAQLKIAPGGGGRLGLLRGGTTLVSTALPFTATAGQPITLRVQATGTNPTTLRTRAWPTGTPEPTTWLATTDSTATLQAPGTIALTSYLSSATTNAPLTLTTDNITATPTA